MIRIDAMAITKCVRLSRWSHKSVNEPTLRACWTALVY